MVSRKRVGRFFGGRNAVAYPRVLTPFRGGFLYRSQGEALTIVMTIADGLGADLLWGI